MVEIYEKILPLQKLFMRLGCCTMNFGVIHELSIRNITGQANKKGVRLFVLLFFIASSH
jgi:hypothetical protein